jgi:hypothetical protein
MIQKQQFIRIGVALTLLSFAAVAFLSPAAGAAKRKVVEIKGVGYNVNASLADNLKSLAGKKVTVTLNSGKTLTGMVKKVGNNLLHLEKLDNKNFYDALIRIEKIVAIDTIFRDYER